jgi:hypothetical protein
MKERSTFDRREFTLAAALAALSGVTITVSACGGGSSPSTPSTPPTPTATPTPAASEKCGCVGSNHGHTAVITAAQLTAPGALNLDITGSASHPHSVQLSAAEVGQIASNQRVSKTSSTDNGHSHTVTFN